MMKLVSMKDVEQNDLPFIEEPFVAASHIKQVFLDPYDSSMRGIDQAIQDNFSFEKTPRNQKSLSKLLDKIASAEIVLVHIFDKPFSPAFRVKKPKSNADGSSQTANIAQGATQQYEVTTSINNPFTGDALQRLATGFYWAKASLPKTEDGDSTDGESEAEDDTDNQVLNDTPVNEQSDSGSNETSAVASSNNIEESPTSYALRFELKDELGQPLKGIPYRVVQKGQASDGQEHLADDYSAEDGKTSVVSTVQGESFDYHVVWAKVSTTKAVDAVRKNQ